MPHRRRPFPAPRLCRLLWPWLVMAGCRQGGADLDSLEDGSRWVWGDLHAHSGWSFDGCEDPDNDCAARGSTPAADLFDNALTEGLDFAALTDHAEADLYFPEGEEGPALGIWEGQSAVVQEALGGPVLPILGYEWTAYDNAVQGGHSRGSHRTVLLSSPTACADWRVAGSVLREPSANRPEAAPTFSQDPSRPIANRAADLRLALADAAERCPGVESLSFVHHPAWDPPQPTDWLLDENAPSGDTIVEIYSEHGSSECADRGAEGCDWATDALHYYPDGSVQTALDEGFRLGFVGGTDGHDGRPGSISDGPSAVAQWEDIDQDGIPDLPRRQLTAGGLTGVLLPAGEALSIPSLFNSIRDRRTLATSGPRPRVEAALFDEGGQSWLPGDSLPAGTGPLTLLARISELDPDEGELRLELIGPGGELLGSAEGPELETDWEAAPGEAAYLRIRIFRTDGEEDRIWLSPWFVDPADCACSAPGPEESPVPLLLGVALLAVLIAQRRSVDLPEGAAEQLRREDDRSRALRQTIGLRRKPGGTR